jgi:hypothetical protein
MGRSVAALRMRCGTTSRVVFLSRPATLKGRRHTNIAIVAMANKIARIAYAVMTSGKPYDSGRGALAAG